MSEYEKQAIDFLKKCCAVMTIKREKIVDRFPGDEKATGYRWKYCVTIMRDGKSWSFPFYDSVMNYRKDELPNEYDVLACLQKYPVGTFEDFLWDFGYEITSNKEYKRIFKTYTAVKNEYKNVENMFGDVLEELAEIY